MSSPATDRCRVMLRDIGRLLPVLDTALEPGKRGPTSPKHAAPSEDQVAAFRAERAERHILQAKYLPESQVPVNLDVVIAITDMKASLTAAYSQALRLCRLPERCRRCNHVRDEHGSLKCGLCSPCPGFGMTYVSPANWRAWDAVLSHDVVVADAIEPHLVTALRAVESVLDEGDDVRLLMQYCPWCAGRTNAMPSGSFTLKAHVSDSNATETFVSCHNLECPVSDDDCGSRYRGRPTWAFHELDWLNAKIDEAVHARGATAA